MRVAIVGSREYKNLENVVGFVEMLPTNTIIVSGGAIGVDDMAEIVAVYYGMDTAIYLPDWNKYGKSAGMRRNTDIVSHCDYLVAFWDGKSTGTLDSIQKAKKLNKPVIIVYDYEI